MEKLICSNCGKQASVSLAFLLSSINQKQRKQKCSTGLRFCKCCICVIIEELELVTAKRVSETLLQAYTAIEPDSGEAGQQPSAEPQQ